LKNLIIIGARGYGREIFHLATHCSENNIDWRIKGFLDDKLDALDKYKGYPPILGPVETYLIKSDDVFVCALGDISFKHYYVNLIKEQGGEFASLIHPASLVYPNTKYGEGLILCPFVAISCDVIIGDFVTIQSYSDLGHDVQIGDYCHINAYSFLGGYVKVGNFTTIHTGAKIIPRLKIGVHSIIGAGSVVIKDVPSKCTVFGNPAKVIFNE
jgi:sugar O-acyltransferase (sialic acid O-acetyltransferase NeuD family)